ncbi:hypothetical protein ACHQM5_015600 [Ranunculus cassubicifolius]
MKHWSWKTVFLCLVLLHYSVCLGCLEQERIALLELKAIIAPNARDLITWVDVKGSDCCSWEKIKCNITTHRVIQLSLKSTYDTYDRVVNASLFLPFQDLQHLDLTDNSLSQRESNEGFEKFSSLKKLEILNLAENRFKNNVLPSLRAIPSLKNVSLFQNALQGSLSQVLGQLNNLEVLDLTANYLDDSFPFEGASNFSKLKVLNLDRNDFTGKIPPSVLSLHSLQALSLKRCNIKDSISGFCNLKNLQELDLVGNKFEGLIPACIETLTSLRFFDLSKNQLTGSVSFSLFSSLKSLQYLDLSQNHFQGTVLSASSVDPMFQLKYLSLRDCILNISSTDLLRFLRNHYDLRHVDIANANVHGEVPIWLLENNTMLETLILGNNSFFGDIRFPFHPGGYLSVIDISSNFIQGQIPTNIGDILPKLSYFNVAGNKLDGTIPSSLGVKTLAGIDLSSNNFTGELPESLALNPMELTTLIVSNNRLQGPISPAFFNITLMTIFCLNNNQFSGSLPNDIVGLLIVFKFDLSGNNISGRIPNWIGNMTASLTLDLGDNSFSGPIPTSLCNLEAVQHLDLSENRLSGSVPSCLMALLYLQFLHLQGNQLSGSIPMPSLQYTSLLVLDLKHNNLSGSIPKWPGSLSKLNVLLLKGNKFSGPVPRELCLLKKVAIMDLSQNMLSGSIPSCFSNITFGKSKSLGLALEIYLDFQTPTYGYAGLLRRDTGEYIFQVACTKQEEIEFRSKSYKGENLVSLSGLDMSLNRISGNIPVEIGALTAIRALNLSYNRLTGQIPSTLTNLEQLESFSVAYNNLSGPVPGQLSKFGPTSYNGNTYLCGAPLQNPCK